MLRLGLTGGIGAGKSTVAKVLTELGGVLVDSDATREVVEPGTPGLQQLTDAFGTEILAPDGSLDRPALARRAFGDEESRRSSMPSCIHWSDSALPRSSRVRLRMPWWCKIFHFSSKARWLRSSIWSSSSGSTPRNEYVG